MAREPEARFKIRAQDLTAPVFKRLQGRFSGLRAQAMNLRTAFQGLAGLAGVGSLAAMSNQVFKLSQRLETFSRVTGFSTDTIQAFEFAAREMGLEAQSADTALQRFSRRVAEVAAGTGVLKKEFERYNIAVRDNSGQMKSSEQLLREYSEVVRNAESEQEQLRLAVQAFDIEGGRFVEVLKQGGAGMENLAKQTKAFGQSLNREQIERLASANRELIKMKNTLTIGFGTAFSTVGRGFEMLFESLLLEDEEPATRLRKVRERLAVFQREWKEARREAIEGDVRAKMQQGASENDPLGILMTPEEMAEMDRQFGKMLDGFNVVRTSAEEFRDIMNLTIENFVRNLAKGTASLRDFGSALKHILIDELFDLFFPKGILGSFGLGNLFGGIGKVLGFQHGGSPPVGRPSIVGESGPEVIVPKAASTVIPANRLGGPVLEQHFHFGEGVNAAAKQAVGEMLPAIQAASMQGIMDAKMRGGHLGGSF